MSLGSQTTQHENRLHWNIMEIVFQQQQAVQRKCRLSIEPQENGEAMSIVNLISHQKLTNRNWFVPVGSAIKMHNILNKHLETTPTLGCTRMPVVNEDSLESSRKHGNLQFAAGICPGWTPASSLPRDSTRMPHLLHCELHCQLLSSHCVRCFQPRRWRNRHVHSSRFAAPLKTHKTNSFENKSRYQIQIEMVLFKRKTKTKVREKTTHRKSHLRSDPNVFGNKKVVL